MILKPLITLIFCLAATAFGFSLAAWSAVKISFKAVAIGFNEDDSSTRESCRLIYRAA